VFYRWQKEFFENGSAAFQSKERPARQVEEKQKRIEFLEKKVQTKDEVLAELMAEHIALKKSLGEVNDGGPGGWRWVGRDSTALQPSLHSLQFRQNPQGARYHSGDGCRLADHVWSLEEIVLLAN
jgi:hypothetical protein